ncbi:MAG TPA: hypothetical protein VLV28_08680 [Gaiellaceae bacterium]|nr:hypothetical protein [Gaiellaceae bacterium]
MVSAAAADSSDPKVKISNVDQARAGAATLEGARRPGRPKSMGSDLSGNLVRLAPPGARFVR